MILVTMDGIINGMTVRSEVFLNFTRFEMKQNGQF